MPRLIAATVCSAWANHRQMLWYTGSCPSAKTVTCGTMKNECLCGRDASHLLPTYTLSLGNLSSSDAWKGWSCILHDFILHAVAGWITDGCLTQPNLGIRSWGNKSLIQINSGRHWTQETMQTWDLWPCWPPVVMEGWVGTKERKLSSCLYDCCLMESWYCLALQVLFLFIGVLTLFRYFKDVNLKYTTTLIASMEISAYNGQFTFIIPFNFSDQQ